MKRGGKEGEESREEISFRVPGCQSARFTSPASGSAAAASSTITNRQSIAAALCAASAAAVRPPSHLWRVQRVLLRRVEPPDAVHLQQTPEAAAGHRSDMTCIRAIQLCSYDAVDVRGVLAGNRTRYDAIVSHTHDGARTSPACCETP